jgi:hypothetical protein
MSAPTANFELRVTSGSRAVTRLLTCCVARGLEIEELRWRAGVAEGHASLVLSGDPARLARAGLWLERLVDVLEVRGVQAAASSTSAPGWTTRAFTPASSAARANASAAPSGAS